MAVDKSKSLIMAQRLKELRNERGLSHESLRKALMEKYEIDISVDSLKNYEVSKVPHVKAYKNDGMRVEYLRCLADFYGVSSDYLLGSDVPKSSNTTIQDMVAYLGISEESILTLYTWNNMEEIMRDGKSEHLKPISYVIAKAKKMNKPIQKGKQIVYMVDKLIAAINSNPNTICTYFSAFTRNIFQYRAFKHKRELEYINGVNNYWNPEDSVMDELTENGFAVMSKGDAAEWYLSKYCDALETSLHVCLRKEADNLAQNSVDR